MMEWIVASALNLMMGLFGGLGAGCMVGARLTCSRSSRRAIDLCVCSLLSVEALKDLRCL